MARKKAEPKFDAEWIEGDLVRLIGDRGEIKFSEALKSVEKSVSYFELLELVKNSPRLTVKGTGKSKLLALSGSEPPEPEGTFWLSIDAIAESPDFQPRGWDWQDEKGIDQDVVEQYAEWLEFSEPPPLEVWQGEIGGTESYWLIAGHHRIRALKARSRDRVQCFTKARTYEEAVYRASISNAGDDRQRQIFKMEMREWAEACRAFLRVCDQLPAETIADFLSRAQKLTGKTKTWSKLNDSAIAAVFGVSRQAVGNYRRQAEWQKAITDKQLNPGQRVEFPSDRINIDRTYRLGEVTAIRNYQLIIDWDSVRVRPAVSSRIENADVVRSLIKVRDPRIEKPQFWFDEPGALLHHWEFGKCVVVAVGDIDAEESSQIWGVGYKISRSEPLIMCLEGTHRGRHFSSRGYDGDDLFDVLGETMEVTLKDRVEALRSRTHDAIAQKQADYLERASQLEPAAPPPENPPSTAPATAPDNPPSSVAEETANTRQQLLGTRSPQGEDGAELPDIPPNDSEPPDEGPPVADRDQVMQATLKKAIFHLIVNLDKAPAGELHKLGAAIEAEIARRS